MHMIQYVYNVINKHLGVASIDTTNNSGVLYKKLMKFSKKRIDLNELRGLCSHSETYREQILELAAKGILVPVRSSGTDGNLQDPLYLRYNIKFEEEPQIPSEEIYSLHPRLIANGYLIRNREKYIENREFLHRLNKWLTYNNDSDMMSRRERSFSIFGDEKALDNHLTFLDSIGISGENLHYYETPEQCFSDYIPVRRPQMTLLICENKDIWFNIRRLMYENGYNRLFGTPIDGVIFGQGNDITGKDKFRSYSDFLGTEQAAYLYCGDIDRAGFDIFLRLCKAAEEISISLFLPAYQEMLRLAKKLILPDSEDRRCIIPDISEILPAFSQDEQSQISQILQDNKRLPQEILSYPVLAENMR